MASGVILVATRPAGAGSIIQFSRKLLRPWPVILFGLLCTSCSGTQGPAAAPVTEGKIPESASDRQNSLPGRQSSPPGIAIDEERLRLIIREELALHSATSASPSAAARPARDPHLDRLHRNYVDRQLDEYRRMGVISPAQMVDLQREIAQLDPQGRKLAMAKLVRALNSGEIAGSL